jgi:hypothetical protein
LDHGDFQEVMVGQNRGGWLFEDVGDLITVALVSIRKTGSPDDEVAIRGPFNSLNQYIEGMARPPIVLETSGLRQWSEGAAFPLIPNLAAGDVFTKIRAHPNFDDQDRRPWSCRPVSEFHATNDKITEKNPDRFFHADLDTEPPDALPVFGGASFNLWQPDTGKRKGWADPGVALTELQRRRESGAGKKNSVFYGFDDHWTNDDSTLPARNCRIAFRDVARATDGRTVISALIPPELTLTNEAPYLLWKNGGPTENAYVLGVLCTTALDWYARRVVELHVNFFIFNRFPIPDPDPTDDRYLRTVEVAGRLAAVDDRYTSWAEAVGVEVGSVTTQAEKDDLIAELDAVVAHLYGLDAEDLEVIWETFYEKIPRNDYRPSLGKVLGFHEDWAR